MSKANSTQLSKATAFARVITGKQAQVLQGGPQDPPCTNGREIVIGSAYNWDQMDRFAVLVHECCHLIFPAQYPSGNIRQLANLIDDCRIERQFLAGRPQYEDALSNLAINVIANGFYDNTNYDRFSDENFDPSLWALLFFRPHSGDEVRLASSAAMEHYIANKGLESPEFRKKFDQLIADGQRITRLKTVSQATLQKWCVLYCEVFPDAKKDLNESFRMTIFQDCPAPKGNQMNDSEGDGDEQEDQKIAGQAKEQKESGKCPLKGGKGKSEKDNGNDKGNDKNALEQLKEAVGKVGDLTKQKAESGSEAESAKKNDDKESTGNNLDDDSDKEEEIGGSAPGWGNPTPGVRAKQMPVDKNFVVKLKMSIRKLRCLVLDRANSYAKTGRLHLPTVINAEKRGILPRKPFKRDLDEIIDAPVACVVATDFSGSTENCNSKLNHFTHNATFALQNAGCECAEVVWNSSAWITKKIEDSVSPVEYRGHQSDGGTCLIAATKGCIEAMRHARAQRKVAFIFTDGSVNGSEVSLMDKHFRQNGFEACLIVSVDAQVPSAGIVSSVVCKDISSLGGIFERWVRNQVAKTASKVIDQ